MFTLLPEALTDDAIAVLLPWRIDKHDIQPMLYETVETTTDILNLLPQLAPLRRGHYGSGRFCRLIAGPLCQDSCRFF